MQSFSVGESMHDVQLFIYMPPTWTRHIKLKEFLFMVLWCIIYHDIHSTIEPHSCTGSNYYFPFFPSDSFFHFRSYRYRIYVYNINIKCVACSNKYMYNIRWWLCNVLPTCCYKSLMHLEYSFICILPFKWFGLNQRFTKHCDCWLKTVDSVHFNQLFVVSFRSKANHRSKTILSIVIVQEDIFEILTFHSFIGSKSMFNIEIYTLT